MGTRELICAGVRFCPVSALLSMTTVTLQAKPSDERGRDVEQHQ